MATVTRRHQMVRLTFSSPLHVGERGIGLEMSSEYLPSDTLFGAICAAWGTLWGRPALEELLNAFLSPPDGQVPFRLSSAFPFVEGEYLLPRPYSRGDLGTLLATEEERKRIKDAKFILKSTFEKWVCRQVIGTTEFDEIARATGLLERVHKEARPRTRIDRATQQADLYFCGTLRFEESSGLYFLYEVAEERSDAFRTCLRFLGEELGVGGERSIGYGRFTPSWEEIDIMEPASPSHHISLSLYYPRENEMQGLDEVAYAYDLMLRSGFSESPFARQRIKRKPCRMFREGSVFTRNVRGTLIDVTPDGLEGFSPEWGSSRILRNGLAYTLGVEIKGEER